MILTNAEIGQKTEIENSSKGCLQPVVKKHRYQFPRKRLIIENHFKYHNWHTFRIILGNFYGTIFNRVFFLFVIDLGYITITCHRRWSDIKWMSRVF